MAVSLSSINSCRITIIMVTYNSIPAIKDTIDNVLSLKQDHLIDFIIIDGGSTDGTVKLLEEFDSKITYWVSEPDKGIYDAMNKGWEKADINSHILFLGAGDKIISLPNESYLKQDVIYFGNAVLGNDNIFNAKVDIRLKFGNTIHHQALLIPKKMHIQPPFNIKYKVYADFDFNQRLLKQSKKFIKSDQIKSYVMPGGFSQHHKNNEWYYIIKINFGIMYAFVGYAYHKYQILRKKTPNV